jgi:hypothetical protein
MRVSLEQIRKSALAVLVGGVLGLLCWWLLDYGVRWAIFIAATSMFIGFALTLPGVSRKRVLGAAAGWIVAHNTLHGWGEKVYEAFAGEDEPAKKQSANMTASEPSRSDEDWSKRFVALMKEVEEKAWWKDKMQAVAETDEQLAVIGPRGDATSEELKLLGQKLKNWQAMNSYVRHIWGLDDLLEGRHPRTPPIYLGIGYPTDRFADCYEPVALVFILKGTDHKEAAESLAQALGELRKRLAWFTDPMDYSNWNR